MFVAISRTNDAIYYLVTLLHHDNYIISMFEAKRFYCEYGLDSLRR